MDTDSKPAFRQLYKPAAYRVAEHMPNWLRRVWLWL